MEMYHNETASRLGFRGEEDWFVWDNPDYKPPESRPAAAIQ
jgi:hypothetical protein